MSNASKSRDRMSQVLAANVALNSLTNVHTYHLAVGAEDGARYGWPTSTTHARATSAASSNIFDRRIVSFNMLCVHAAANVQVRRAAEITDDAAHPLVSNSQASACRR